MAASNVKDGKSVLDEAAPAPTPLASRLLGELRSFPLGMLLQLDPYRICLRLERHTCAQYPDHQGIEFSIASSSYLCRRASKTNIVDMTILRAMKFRLVRM